MRQFTIGNPESTLSNVSGPTLFFPFLSSFSGLLRVGKSGGYKFKGLAEAVSVDCLAFIVHYLFFDNDYVPTCIVESVEDNAARNF